jgi:IS1 family transposase
MVVGFVIMCASRDSRSGKIAGFAIFCAGSFVWLTGHYSCEAESYGKSQNPSHLAILLDYVKVPSGTFIVLRRAKSPARVIVASSEPIAKSGLVNEGLLPGNRVAVSDESTEPNEREIYVNRGFDVRRNCFTHVRDFGLRDALGIDVWFDGSRQVKKAGVWWPLAMSPHLQDRFLRDYDGGGSSIVHQVKNTMGESVSVGWRKIIYDKFQSLNIRLCLNSFQGQPRAFNIYQCSGVQQSGIRTLSEQRSLASHADGLSLNLLQSLYTYKNASNARQKEQKVWQVFRCKQSLEVSIRLFAGPLILLVGCFVIYHSKGRARDVVGGLLVAGGLACYGFPLYHQEDCPDDSNVFHGDKLYHKNYLTSLTLCNTFSDMANVLPFDKQVAAISALAEGSSIRSIERMTGVHRDTVMRLGLRVGEGCAALLDGKMRNLPCERLEFDEVWGFIGKKERHLRPGDDPQYGDVWTFCAIDADTKLVPSFRCGKRDLKTAKAFVADVASRIPNRIQISADALRAYQDAIEQVYGADVDFGQIIKTYEHDHVQHPELKYSAPKFVGVEKRAVAGDPDMDLVSTSYVERLNATTRLHMRRLTRLTLAFSKKLENFEAAVALHFAYYNLVKRHGSLRCTPAMAAGVERDFWTVGQLIEAVA